MREAQRMKAMKAMNTMKRNVSHSPVMNLCFAAGISAPLADAWWLTCFRLVTMASLPPESFWRLRSLCAQWMATAWDFRAFCLGFPI